MNTSSLAVPAPIANLFSRFRLQGGLGAEAGRSVASESDAAFLLEARDEVRLLSQMDATAGDLEPQARAVSLSPAAKETLGKAWAVEYAAVFSSGGGPSEALIHTASTSHDHDYRLVLDGQGATSLVTATIDMNEIYAEALIPLTNDLGQPQLDGAGNAVYEKQWLLVSDSYLSQS